MMKETLTTARLVLRKHKVSDLAESMALWNDIPVLKALGTPPRSRAEVWTKLLYHRGHWDHYGYGCYTVRDKTNGRFLGEVGLKHYMRDAQLPYSDTIPEVGWLMHSHCHGKGYASEALGAVFAETDSTLTVPTCCMIAPDNQASRALAVKFGFEKTDSLLLGNKVVDFFVRSPRVSR
ncbi:hypothetical protein CKK34_2544 [Yarrowia sp. E02]|nr:hypothetical protein CKK34_2544 [Yarrowia sp. E02]